MNRVEITKIQDLPEFLNFRLPKDFDQLTTNLPNATNACLKHLSVSIAALSQNDLESSNLVVNICTKNLLMGAFRVVIPKQGTYLLYISLKKIFYICYGIGFTVTQALVNILSTHGGCSLMDLPKEEICLSPRSERLGVGTLTLANALSAYILSTR